MTYTPKNLMDAVRYFGDLRICNDYMRSIKWPDGICCHHCGSVAVYELSTRPVLKCRDCNNRRGMDAKKPKGFGKLDALMRKLVKPVSATTAKPKARKQKRK